MGKPLVVIAYLMVCFGIYAARAQLDNVVFNATVSTTGEPGSTRTITEALAAAPTNSKTKYYIHVKSGTYFERVEVWQNKTNIVLIGDGASTTKVQMNRHVPDFGTDETGTITVSGDGFIAMEISFENTAGDVGQAAAAVVTANNVAFYRCTFRGYQDTLYAKWGIQFYKNCDIYGTVDFISGAAAAVFQSCNLYVAKARTVTFTDQSKGALVTGSPPSGFVIQNSTLTVAPGVDPRSVDLRAYLGRQWSDYSTVIVMESYLDSIIRPEGWYNSSYNPNTSYLREYNNLGPGSNTINRVKWPGYKDVSGHPEEIKNFTVGEFINKDGWLHGALIPYSDGFTDPSP